MCGPAMTGRVGAMQTNTPLHRTLTLTAVALGLLAVSACGDLADSLSGSDTKPHAVDSGAEGKASGLLAAWVPDDATEIQVLQKTTGSERLLAFSYDGDLPEECFAIDDDGAPTEEELERSYATDLRTADSEVGEWSTDPTMEADWWPAGQHRQTTQLCGRWWVSHSGDTYYGFAAEFRPGA